MCMDFQVFGWALCLSATTECGVCLFLLLSHSYVARLPSFLKLPIQEETQTECRVHLSSVFPTLPGVQLCFDPRPGTLQRRPGSLSVRGGKMVEKGLSQQRLPEQQTGRGQVKDSVPSGSH